MATRSLIISSEFADFEYDMVVDDDLSVWEFINPSSSSEDDVDFDLGDDDFSIADEVEEEDLTVEPIKVEEVPVEIVGSPCSDISVETEPFSPGIGRVVVTAGVVVAAAVVDDDVDEYGDDEGHGGDDDDYDDYNDGYDLDDELVPWGFSKKFGKQRISKLAAAKRASPRIKGSKKLVYRCAHGKHGIGLKHRYSS